jgi:hypothetical protein
MSSQPTTYLIPEEYLAIERKIEQYGKQVDGRWLLSDYGSPEDVIELDSIQCRLALREVYNKVALP